MAVHSCRELKNPSCSSTSCGKDRAFQRSTESYAHCSQPWDEAQAYYVTTHQLHASQRQSLLPIAKTALEFLKCVGYIIYLYQSWWCACMACLEIRTTLYWGTWQKTSYVISSAHANGRNYRSYRSYL